MEPPRGFWPSLWSFLRFLPFFFALLLLGIIKGLLIFPWTCLIMTTGNSALILGLWPVHAVWTYYCLIRTKQLGPVLKLVLSIGVCVALFVWPLAGILGSIMAGIVYGFLAPVMATFDAVGEGKSSQFLHCFVDGTWSTIKGTCTVVRDLKDLLFHSYFSIMDDLRLQSPPAGKPYEIRLLSLPGALFVGVLGIVIDGFMFSLIALCKSPIMLFKGWKRLVQDLIGREGPFLETACVPFAGLAIILWPLAVVGSVIASMLSSIPLGAYGAVVAYQESSVRLGINYVLSSVSIFDEYTNDVLDMPEGSCFPRFQYRKKEPTPSNSFSRPASFQRQETKNFPRATSFKNSMQDLNPFKLLDNLFSECRRHGELLVAEGCITREDIEEAKLGKVGQGVLSVGLPAYVILKALLRSAKADVSGIILHDGSEITSDNRPKQKILDWFFDPLMVIKDQLKAENFSEEEESYLCKLVLLLGDSERVKNLTSQVPPLNERKRAEINAFARRLQGITKSISRYPTAKRRFDGLVKSMSEELEKKMGISMSSNGSSHMRRIRSGIGRMLSQKSMGRTISIQSEDKGEESANDVISPV
ncbi:transmembrane protein [Rhynchospora pubera]|uniref:Transmembrane protein n=1 Tax=Rhynchospora pubera TaxID=906938 RepID=A0AAV8D6A5_9POAL|nr:transmembrane protein [Rhynchospora pubera]